MPLDRADAQMIGEEVAKALKMGGGTSFGSAPTPSMGGGTQDNVGMLGRFTNNFIGAVGQMTTGTYNLTNAIGTVSQVMGIFGPVGRVFGEGFQGASQYLVEMNNNLIATSQSGQNFNNNLGLFTEMTGLAGISQQDYVKMVQQNSQILAGTGVSANMIGQTFLKNAEEIRKDSTVFRSLILDPSLFQDYNHGLMRSTDLLRNYDQRETSTRKMMIDSTIIATTEIDNMSRITGRSRQELQKTVDTQMQSRTMEIAKYAMSAEELARYQQSSSAFSALGNKYNDLFTEVSANQGNIVSQEGNVTAGALERIAPGVTQTMRELAVETDAQRRKELEAEIQYRIAQGTQDRESMQNLVANAKSGNEVARAAIDILIEGKGAIGASTNMLRDAGGDFAKFRTELAKVPTVTQSEKEKALSGTGLEGGASTTSQAINFTGEAIKTVSGGVSMGMNALNKVGGEQLVELKLNNAINQARFARDFAMTPDKIGAFLKENVGYTGVNTSKPADSNKPNLPEFKRSLGSIGSNDMPKVDKWFEDFGAGRIGQLDGIETVLRKQDVPAFIKDQLATNPGILQGLAGGIRSLEQATSQASSNVDLKSLVTTLEKIGTTTSVSAATPKSSTSVYGDVNDATTELIKVMNLVNTNIVALKTAVEDGTHRNVRAVKGQGNALA